MHPEDIDEEDMLNKNPFWYCENCGAQNSRLDGECQFCEPMEPAGDFHDMHQEERLWPTVEEPDDIMDGDMESGLASAGFGTDEDYGYFGGEEE